MPICLLASASSASTGSSSPSASSPYPHLRRYLRPATTGYASAVAQLAVVVVAGSLMAAGEQGSPGLAVVLALAVVAYLPVVALIGGALIALAYVLPVLAFAEWAADRRGGSVPAWRAGAVLGLGALYAVPFGVGDPSGYLLAWVLVCLSVVLPLAIADRTDRADRAGRTAGTGRAGRLRLAPWVWGFALFWLTGVVIGCAALLAP